MNCALYIQRSAVYIANEINRCGRASARNLIDDSPGEFPCSLSFCEWNFAVSNMNDFVSFNIFELLINQKAELSIYRSRKL